METAKKYRLDKRDVRNVREQIEELAKSYTPEWIFEEKNADAGSCIAMIFSDQLAENISKYNMVLEKYHTEFANMYGITAKSASPAQIVVTMDTSTGIIDGVPLQKGTRITGTTSQENDIIFETDHDIYVTGSKLIHFFNVSKHFGKIIPCEIEENELLRPVKLFSGEGECIGYERLLIYHDYLFHDRNIRIRLNSYDDIKRVEEFLAKKDCYRIYALNGENMIPCKVLIEGNEIFIEKNDSECNLIVIEETDMRGPDLILSDIEIVTPDAEGKAAFISSADIEIKSEEFPLFNEQLTPFAECYISNDELFAKKGAECEITFNLSFGSKKEELIKEEEELKIIKRKRVVNYKPVISDCYAQEVILEYENELGWKRLECSLNTEKLFANEANAGEQRITFTVPEDWIKSIVNGYEGYCIRLRLIKADNSYVKPVIYHYPMIANLNIACRHRGKYSLPKQVVSICENNVTDCTKDMLLGNSFRAFKSFHMDGNYLYLGFDKKFEKGPIGIFLWLEEIVNFQGMDLRFEYSAQNGFKTLQVTDHTDGFKKAGLITFEPPTDFSSYEFLGREGYYIRIKDARNIFNAKDKLHPTLKKLMVNSVLASNVLTSNEEQYTIDEIHPYMSFPLQGDNILSADVWVNEKGLHTYEEMKLLLSDKTKARAEYNIYGEIEDFFVKWEEVEQFDEAGDNKRIYQIDRYQNRLIFGDGVNSYLPQNTKGIAFRVIVKSCLGSAGNIQPENVTGFLGNVFFVDHVNNPIAAYGGCDMEEIDTTLERGNIIIGSRKRLVAEQDYINEIKMYSDTISDAACISGKTITGDANSQLLSIVLLMKDYADGSFSFYRVKNSLLHYLVKSCEMAYGENEIQIMEPVFVRVSVETWLIAEDITDTYEIQQKWLDTINSFLSPIKKNGFAGWSIGRLPKENRIRMLAGVIDQKVSVKQISIRAEYTDGENTCVMPLDSVIETPFMVCCNGEHVIHVQEERYADKQKLE